MWEYNDDKRHACFDDLVDFSVTNSFDLKEFLPGRESNRLNSAETRIFKLLNVNGSNARRLELKIHKQMYQNTQLTKLLNYNQNTIHSRPGHTLEQP